MADTPDTPQETTSEAQRRTLADLLAATDNATAARLARALTRPPTA